MVLEQQKVSTLFVYVTTKIRRWCR